MPAEIREVAARYIEKNTPSEYPGLNIGVFLFAELVAQFATFNDMVATEIRKTNMYLHQTNDHLKALADEVERASWRVK